MNRAGAAPGDEWAVGDLPHDLPYFAMPSSVSSQAYSKD